MPSFPNNLLYSLSGFLLFLFLPQFSSSQPNSLGFEHISTSEGLSQGNVNDLYLDSYGFMWVATQDGLNRYDAYDFKLFQHEPGNPKSLGSNYIWKILEDQHSNLWIGTFGGGLSKWDRKTESFQNFLPDPSHPTSSLAHNGVRSFYMYQDSLLLIGTDYGLSMVNIHSHAIQSWPYAPGDSLSCMGRNILAIAHMGEAKFMLGDEKGLSIFDLTEESCKRLDFKWENQEAKDYFISDILKVDEQEYWIATSMGLLLLERQGDEFKLKMHIEKAQLSENGLLSNGVTSLFLDKNQKLWIGTAEGLNYAEVDLLKKEGAKSLKGSFNDPKSPQSLSHNRVNCILGDQSENLWLGTQNGINKTSIRKALFRNISFENTEGGLCHNNVLGINQREDGQILVATVGGLSELVLNEGQASSIFCQSLEDRIGTDYLLNICKDTKDQFWLGTRRGGFAKMSWDEKNELQLRQYLHDEHDPNSLSANRVYTIFEDKAGDYWVGTALGGLNKFDPLTQSFQSFLHDPEDSSSLPHPFVFCIEEDRKGNLWIGTAGGGLSKMDRTSGTFQSFRSEEERPTSLSNDMILDIYESKSGDLWICTANGLCLMEEEGQFRRFFQKDGLPNDVIYGMLEDDRGNLWVSTNQGISRINWENEEFNALNFGLADGLGSLEFNQFSFFKSQDGHMLFGGVNGLNIFHPDSLRLNESLPKVQISRLKLFNAEVPIANELNKSEAFRLANSISTTNEIHLNYDQNFLSFEFTALEYTQPEKNQFAYQLLGVDRDWVYSGNRRFADYPNLAPGDYTFRVKASNNDGLWNEQAKELHIYLSPPPWKSWWAYSLYALAVLGAIFLFISYRTQQVRQEMKTLARIERIKVEEREQLRARTSQDFHDEAGNNLTKLSLYTGLSKRSAQDNPDLQEYLQKMEENLQELGSGIRDFIWTLDPRQDSLHATLDRIRDFASSLFEHTDIEFHFENQLQGDEKENLSLTTKRHLLLICKEALNNVLKYADCGKVSIQVERKEKDLLLQIQDNGKGFEEEELKRINGLNNMRNRAKEMDAQIEIESGESQGTSIRLLKEMFK